MVGKIINKLDTAINNLENDNFIELFPIILVDLDYILNGFIEDKKHLSSEEEFESGILFEEKIHTYYAKLAKVYFKYLYGVNISIISQNSYNLSMAGGGYSTKDGNIYYSLMGAMLSKKSDLSFLHTCLHEGRHKMQHRYYQMNNPVLFPPYMLKVLKESLLESSLTGNNREFYTTNYKMLYAENDAEIFARDNVYFLIEKMFALYKKLSKKSPVEIMKLWPAVQGLRIRFGSILREEEFNINSDISRQLSGEDMVQGPHVLNGKLVDKLIIMDKFIKSHPELQGQYPILKLLFNGNSVKSYEEIILDRERLKTNLSPKEQKRIDALYEEIILLDPILMLTDLLDKCDTQAAKDYIDLHPMILKGYPKEIEQLSEKYGHFYGLVK